jgi:hypothetical protein
MGLSVSCQSSEKTPPGVIFSQSFPNSSLPVTAIHFLASTIGLRQCRRPANVRYGSNPAARLLDSQVTVGRQAISTEGLALILQFQSESG